MNETWRTVILALGIAWGIQYGLAYFQLKRFYRRINELRRLGTVSIGKGGSTWRLKIYVVLVVDKEKRIVHVEQLSGWTILAKLRPLPGLEGRPVQDLFDDTLALPVTQKQLLALRSAAEFIIEAEERKNKKKKSTEEEEDAVENEENTTSSASPMIAS
jgi:DNA-binding transcriptional regulator of glucitol operon